MQWLRYRPCSLQLGVRLFALVNACALSVHHGLSGAGLEDHSEAPLPNIRLGSPSRDLTSSAQRDWTSLTSRRRTFHVLSRAGCAFPAIATGRRQHRSQSSVALDTASHDLISVSAIVPQGSTSYEDVGYQLEASSQDDATVGHACLGFRGAQGAAERVLGSSPGCSMLPCVCHMHGVWVRSATDQLVEHLCAVYQAALHRVELQTAVE